MVSAFATGARLVVVQQKVADKSNEITAIPLLLFNGSTTRLPYTVIGLLQYITPTIQFSIGVWIRHEDMPTARWVGFAIIWCALIALAIDLLRSGRAIDNSVA